MRVSVRWRGLEEIRRTLELMPQEVAGAHLREVAMVGAEVIRQQAVQNALKHKRTGTLAENIEKEISRESRSATTTRVVVHIGPNKKAWYGRLLETGHAIVVGGRKDSKRNPGTVVGHVPPYPWLRPALDAKRREAQQVMAEELRRRLSRLWK